MSALAGFARELRGTVAALRDELESGGSGVVEVSGVLAEQLVRELARDAQPGAVRVGGDTPSATAEVLVRVVAGDPTEVDEAYVGSADGNGVPVVLVQLWPQADWTGPFVLSPFVVECRAGEGFPLQAIGDSIVDAVDPDSALPARVPSIRRSLERKLVLRSVVRAALLGALAGSRRTRPLLTLEQARLVARLTGSADAAQRASVAGDPRALGVVAGALFASGLGFREAARAARVVLPSRVANAAVAAAGTWALANAATVYSARNAP